MLTEVVVVITPVRVMVVVKVARQVLTVHTGDGHHWREHTASLIKTPEMYTDQFTLRLLVRSGKKYASVSRTSEQWCEHMSWSIYILTETL